MPFSSILFILPINKDIKNSFFLLSGIFVILFSFKKSTIFEESIFSLVKISFQSLGLPIEFL